MIKNRTASFIILAVVYALAITGGYIFYRQLFCDYRLVLLYADIFATVITFIFSVIFKNASVYAPYWSVQPLVIIAFFAYSYGLNMMGFFLTLAISYWGLRLTSNWAYTFSNLTVQDWRYTMLKEKTGIFYPFINFIGIHLVPTLIVYGCTLPAVTAIHDRVQFKPLCLIFIALSIGAATLQLIADIQMHRFQKNRTTTFIECGVWKHGRHPNYLGEILMWWGIGLACLTAMPGNYMLLTGTAANTILFLCVSIPLADGRQSKKNGYPEYKKRTRIFISKKTGCVRL